MNRSSFEICLGASKPWGLYPKTQSNLKQVNSTPECIYCTCLFWRYNLNYPGLFNWNVCMKRLFVKVTSRFILKREYLLPTFSDSYLSWFCEVPGIINISNTKNNNIAINYRNYNSGYPLTSLNCVLEPLRHSWQPWVILEIQILRNI